MTQQSLSKVMVVGGAGFIGSHFVAKLLSDSQTELVTIYDNFSSGKLWHLEDHQGDSRLRIVSDKVENLENLVSSTSGHDTIIHLASNPDIAAAITNPAIDFDQGSLLTHSVVEAARRSGVRTVLYASGSGVYGDLGELEASENYGPVVPISTYAASKLAGEAMLSAYSFMFGIQSIVFRFGNVVGPRQTHGVGYDFIRRLRRNPSQLTVLGDGRQSKSYVHVDDVVTAVLTAARVTNSSFEIFNIATGDYITVREIAAQAIKVLGLDDSKVRLEFGSSDRGWKGDVPIIRLATNKIRSLGWKPRYNCFEAIRQSLASLAKEARICNE